MAKAFPIVPRGTPIIVKDAPVVATAPLVIAKAAPVVVPKAAPVVVAKSLPDVPKAAPVVVAKAVPAKAAPQLATALPTPRLQVKPDSLPPAEHASGVTLPKAPVPLPKLITPQARERYLQLAALGPTYTDKYLPQLRAKGFNPVVAPGPTDGIYRIIIGPFPDQLALAKQRDVLEAAGIQTFERVY
jgi:hypothetical protein